MTLGEKLQKNGNASEARGRENEKKRSRKRKFETGKNPSLAYFREKNGLSNLIFQLFWYIKFRYQLFLTKMVNQILTYQLFGISNLDTNFFLTKIKCVYIVPGVP